MVAGGRLSESLTNRHNHVWLELLDEDYGGRQWTRYSPENAQQFNLIRKKTFT